VLLPEDPEKVLAGLFEFAAALLSAVDGQKSSPAPAALLPTGPQGGLPRNCRAAAASQAHKRGVSGD
jgi:hypothetical protein